MYLFPLEYAQIRVRKTHYSYAVKSLQVREDMKITTDNVTLRLTTETLEIATQQSD